MQRRWPAPSPALEQWARASSAHTWRGCAPSACGLRAADIEQFTGDAAGELIHYTDFSCALDSSLGAPTASGGGRWRHRRAARRRQQRAPRGRGSAGASQPGSWKRVVIATSACRQRAEVRAVRPARRPPAARCGGWPRRCAVQASSRGAPAGSARWHRVPGCSGASTSHMSASTPAAVAGVLDLPICSRVANSACRIASRASAALWLRASTSCST